MKILNFEPEDECNSALEAACGRISSLKTVKTHFELKDIPYSAQLIPG